MRLWDAKIVISAQVALCKYMFITNRIVGGSVSIGLTATTIVSQWTWSATLLQSTTVASKVQLDSKT